MTPSEFREGYEAGLLVPAIAGVDGFFRASPGNDAEHDFRYALSELMAWAVEHAKEREATEAVKDAAQTLLDRDEPAACLRLIWVYLIVRDRRGFPLAVQPDELAQYARAARDRGAGGADTPGSLWSLVDSALQALRA